MSNASAKRSVTSSTISIVSGVRWAGLTIALLVITVIAWALCGWALWASLDAEHRQNVQDAVVDALALKEQDDVNALTAADSEIVAELVNVNASLWDSIAFLSAALNLTNYNGNTFIQQIEAQLASAVSDLTAALDLRMISVNNVDGDNTTHNIDLLAGAGIGILPSPSTHTLTISNGGVLTLSGINPPNLGGNIDLLGTGMLSVYGDSNTSSITVDASLLVTAITNLQTQNAAQQSEIADLQANVTTLELQINNLQLAEFMIEQALNGTVTNINVTLTGIIAALIQAQTDIAELQAQVANQTASSAPTPTGAMLPWTGAPSTVPTGYLLCDGSQYLAGDYPELYVVIGTLYCEGNCSVGSFRVPAMGGRVPVGLGGGGVFQAAVGTEVGNEQQTLSTPNLPSHTHSASTVSAGAHTHTTTTNQIGTINTLINHGAGGGNTDTFFGATGSLTSGFHVCSQSSIAVDNCGGTANFPAGAPYYTTMTGFYASSAGLQFGDHNHGTDSQGTHTHTVNVGNTGSGTAFDIVQPSVVVQYIIKT